MTPESDANTVQLPAGHGTIAGRYLLREIVGGGGFGTVYRADDTLLDRTVAIKVIRRREEDDGTSDERFLREARTTARFRHPNVVSLFDAGEDPSGRYLVLEYVDGESLQALVQRGPVPLGRAIDIVRQIAVALDAGHRQQIVHRDLKPANVLLLRDGEVKLADFGLARLAGETRLTREGAVVGTVNYLSPEQIERGDAAPSSDIFALGILFQELLTGRPPFRASSDRETIARILAARPDPLPEPLRGDARVANLIDSMLSREAARRPSAAEVVRELGGVVRRPRSFRTFWISVGIAGFLLAGAIAIQMRPRTPAYESSPIASISIRLRNAPAEEVRRALENPVGWRHQPGVRVRVIDERVIELTASDIRNAAAAVAVIDSLWSNDFFKEANTFAGLTPSPRKVTLNVKSYPLFDFIRLVTTSAGWPVVIDSSVGRTPLSFEMRDVPWDEMVRTILDRHDLRERREGGLWLIASKARWEQLDARGGPSIAVYSDPEVPPESLARLLEPARTKNGVIAVNPRLRSVVVADRPHVFADYQKILRDAGLTRGDARTFHRRFAGEPISINLANADVRDVMRTIGQLTGLSIVVDPDVQGSVSFDVTNVPWDQFFEAVLVSQGLWFTGPDPRSKVVRVMKDSNIRREVSIEAVRLANEDPEFFRPFATIFDADATLVTDRASRTIVIRSREAAAFARWAREIDAMPRQ